MESFSLMSCTTFQSYILIASFDLHKSIKEYLLLSSLLQVHRRLLKVWFNGYHYCTTPYNIAWLTECRRLAVVRVSDNRPSWKQVLESFIRQPFRKNNSSLYQRFSPSSYLQCSHSLTYLEMMSSSAMHRISSFCL